MDGLKLSMERVSYFFSRANLIFFRGESPKGERRASEANTVLWQ